MNRNPSFLARLVAAGANRPTAPNSLADATTCMLIGAVLGILLSAAFIFLVAK